MQVTLEFNDGTTIKTIKKPEVLDYLVRAIRLYTTDCRANIKRSDDANELNDFANSIHLSEGNPSAVPVV
jgi:hypothetical protein